jgi:hypothetical protein
MRLMEDPPRRSDSSLQGRGVIATNHDRRALPAAAFARMTASALVDVAVASSLYFVKGQPLLAAVG